MLGDQNGKYKEITEGPEQLMKVNKIKENSVTPSTRSALVLTVSYAGSRKCLFVAEHVK